MSFTVTNEERVGMELKLHFHRRTGYCAIFGLLLVVHVHDVNSDERAELHELDQFIKHVVRCRHVPGLAISLVRGEDVLFSRGYGHADAERGVKATEHTKFCIGSLTKAFTTALIADVLSKHKNLTWDTPIRQILGSNFRLSDRLRTDHVNLRDLLAHKVGTPSNFHPLLVGFPEGVTRPDLVRKLQYMPAVSDFRSKFHYSNYMYMLAGHVAEFITGETWEDMVTERLLGPLGMRDTGFVDKLNKLTEIAVPYVLKNGKLAPVDKELLLSVSPSGPAGSIFSTASDMAKWMQFHFRGGKSKNRNKLIDPAWLTEVYHSQMTHPFSEKDLVKPHYPITDTSVSYNMGWMTSVYRGYKKLWHSGGIVTFTSQLWMFPDLEAGVFATSSGTLSSHSSSAVKAIMARASDLLLGEDPWLNMTTGCTYPAPWNLEKVMKPASDNLDYTWHIPQPLSDYEGVYGHKGFGNITVVTEHSDQLYLYYGRFGKMRLKPTYVNRFTGYYTDKLWFITNSDGNTNGIVMEFVFSKQNKTVVEGLLFPIDFQEQMTLFKKGSVEDPGEGESSFGEYTSIACGSGLSTNSAKTPHSCSREAVFLFLQLIIMLTIV